MAGFLPINAREMRALGWERPDFVYVLGDAYVDHPSFGHAIISRVLERAGYRVAMLPQPDWRDPSSVLEFGEPRLGFLVTGGNMDSMVNHYSVGRHRRRTDAYTPGGVTGKRPDYATVVYCNLIRRSFPKIPILIGGIEASLRRLAHYDYWSDSLKRSILLDSQADLLLYGMGERAIVEVADAMNSGLDIHDITFVNGTVYRTRDCSGVVDAITLPPYDELRADRRRYAESFAVQYRNTDPFSARCLIEPYGREFVVQNPPQPPLSTQEMDDVYALPYQDTYHPSYRKAGGVPAIAEVQFSLVSNRGCFGGCSFCALTFHQGRIIQTRSHDSLLAEAARMTQHPDFKGYIHDVGGPTANFRQPACEKQLTHGACQNRQCLFPTPCRNLRADHTDYVNLLRELRAIPGVKKVFIRSGIRFDYLLVDPDQTFLRELVEYHVSGQLKVAPSTFFGSCAIWGKPRHAVYEKFCRQICRAERKARQKAVSRALSYELPPRLWPARGRGAGGICPRPRLYAGTGAGFLSRPRRSRPSCTIRASIPGRWSRSMCRPTRTKKKCSARSSSTATRRTMPLSTRPLSRPGARTLIGYGPKCHPAAPRGRKGAAPGAEATRTKRPAQKRGGPQKRNLRQSRARRNPPQRTRAEQSAGRRSASRRPLSSGRRSAI